MGVKKSTVCTRARFRSRRYTPASSKVFELTSTFRPNEIGSCGKTCRRACWLNLEAHPAQDESDVSLRICSRDIWFTPFPMFDVRGLMFDSISGADLRPIENRQSKIKNRVTERIGIEPTSVRRLPDRQQS